MFGSGSAFLNWIKQPNDMLHAAKPEEWAGMAQIRLERPGDEPRSATCSRRASRALGRRIWWRRCATTAISCSPRGRGRDVVVGYVCFSRLWVEGEATATPAVALAPLAVYPEYQQQGIATRLIREAHACLAAMGEKLAIVLGEPHYYNRFGYNHRRAAGFDSDYQSHYLMAISFGAAPGDGRLVYRAGFRGARQQRRCRDTR